MSFFNVLDPSPVRGGRGGSSSSSTEKAVTEMRIQVETYKRACGRKKTHYQGIKEKQDAELQRYTREGNAKAGAYALSLVKKAARAMDQIDKDIQSADTLYLEVSGADDLQKMAGLQGAAANAFREVNGKLSVTQMSRTTQRLTQQMEVLKSKREMIGETNDELREGMLEDGDDDGTGADIETEYAEWIKMQQDMELMKASESQEAKGVPKRSPMQILADELYGVDEGDKRVAEKE